jgi:hypothetical protein
MVLGLMPGTALTVVIQRSLLISDAGLLATVDEKSKASSVFYIKNHYDT